MEALTVAEVAERAGVSQAAVRARLADGTIRGQQRMRGKRSVWAVEAASAQKYIAGRRGEGRGVKKEPVKQEGPEGVAQGDVKLADLDRAVAQLPGPVRPAATRATGELEALRKENAQLRGVVQGLRRAHSELLAVIAGTYDD